MTEILNFHIIPSTGGMVTAVVRGPVPINVGAWPLENGDTLVMMQQNYFASLVEGDSNTTLLYWGDREAPDSLLSICPWVSRTYLVDRQRVTIHYDPYWGVELVEVEA